MLLCTVLCVVLLLVIFFFKQKTAYEMRISDWSSDVCSSDLKLFIGLRPCLYHRRALGTAVAVLQCAQVAKAVAEPRAFETFHPQAVADCRGPVACSLLLPGRGGRDVEHGQGRQGRGQFIVDRRQRFGKGGRILRRRRRGPGSESICVKRWQ